MALQRRVKLMGVGGGNVRVGVGDVRVGVGDGDVRVGIGGGDVRVGVGGGDVGVGGGDVRVGRGEEVGNAGQRTLEQVQHRKAELGNSVISVSMKFYVQCTCKKQ